MGGNGGNIDLTNSGKVTTTGKGANGITAISVGGTGIGGDANGGDGFGGDAFGGAGGNSGNASASSTNGTTAGPATATTGNGGNGGAGGTGGDGTGGAGGIGGGGAGGNSGNIHIVNRGDISATGEGSHGIFAEALGGVGIGGTANGGVGTGGTAPGGVGGTPGGAGAAGNPASATAGSFGFGGSIGPAGLGLNGANGIAGLGTNGVGGSIAIENSGSVLGNASGITTIAGGGTSIVNSGFISAISLLAIDTNIGATSIMNTGTITGFIDLTDQADTFINQKGGVFETKLTSDFGPATDLFRNEQGGTVLAATDPKTIEHSSFINLERFENQGLITMQDGQAGDSFRDLQHGGRQRSQIRRIRQCDLGGRCLPRRARLDLRHLHHQRRYERQDPGRCEQHQSRAGVLNTVGIPVVYVNGNNVNSDAFYPEQADRHRLFQLRPVLHAHGSGRVRAQELLGPRQPSCCRSSRRPQQDLWHEGSDTWFDRTADLRVLLNGGAAPAEDPRRQIC